MLARHKTAILIGVGILILDQITKYWALIHVAPVWPIEITGFFNLVLVWNSGVSFGMFGSSGEWGRWLLTAVALGFSVLLAYWLWREENRLNGFAYAMVIAGAIGNVIDRLRFGAVVDFLDFHYAGYHWPAFNVADSAIVIGAALIALGLFGDEKGPNNAASKT